MKQASGLIDTHAHLQLFKPNEVAGLLRRAVTAGVDRIICVGIDLHSSEQAAAFAETGDGIYAAIGIHPHDAEKAPADYYDRLRRLVKRPEVVAVGETGLDFYRLLSPKAAQQELFRRHIELAAETGLPLIVHCRDAYDDTIALLKQTRPASVVMHCFSGTVAQADELLAVGCFLSFAGTVTFKGAKNIQAAAARTPMNRLLLETDAPYLAPAPYRGRRNEPAYLAATAAAVSELKAAPLGEVIKATADNADKLFGEKISKRLSF